MLRDYQAEAMRAAVEIAGACGVIAVLLTIPLATQMIMAWSAGSRMDQVVACEFTNDHEGRQWPSADQARG